MFVNRHSRRAVPIPPDMSYPVAVEEDRKDIRHEDKNKIRK